VDVPEPFRAYAHRASAGIDDRSERRAAAEEIVDHLMEAFADERAKGASEADAVAAALGRMGGAEDVQRPIEEAHTPRFRPAVVVGFVGLGLLVLFAIWLVFYLTFLGL